MRYLTLSADYGAPNLRDEDLDNGAVIVSQALQLKLDAWNRDYEPIVKMTSNERQAELGRIEGLDATGRELAAEVAASLGREVKIEYYSEGLGRRL